MRQQENIRTEDILRWYNNEHVVPTLEAMQEMVVFLRQWRNWHVKAWMYFAKYCKYLSSQINYCKVLSLHSERQWFIGEKKWRHVWWIIHCIYQESCCERYFLSECDQLLQFHCRKWRKSALSFLYVSSSATWFLQEMGTRFWIWHIWTSTKQDEEFWKHAHVLLSASHTIV